MNANAEASMEMPARDVGDLCQNPLVADLQAPEHGGVITLTMALQTLALEVILSRAPERQIDACGCLMGRARDGRPGYLEELIPDVLPDLAVPKGNLGAGEGPVHVDPSLRRDPMQYFQDMQKISEQTLLRIASDDHLPGETELEAGEKDCGGGCQLALEDFAEPESPPVSDTPAAAAAAGVRGRAIDMRHDRPGACSIHRSAHGHARHAY